MSSTKPAPPWIVVAVLLLGVNQSLTPALAAGLGTRANALATAGGTDAFTFALQADARIKQLADKLIGAATEDERRALLAAEPELATVALRKSLIEQGTSLRSKKNYEQSMTCYRLARMVAEQIHDEVGVAEALEGFGQIHFAQSDFPRAFENYQASLERYEALGDKGSVARALVNIGLVHSWRGDHHLALAYYDRSLAINAAADKLRTAQALNSIGIAHLYLGNYELALDNYQRALRLAEELRSKQGMLITLSNIGGIYQSQGRYALALESYNKSLLISEELDKTGHPSTLMSIGSLHAEQGNDELALDYFRKSLALFEQVGNKHSAANVLAYIGMSYLAQGDIARALEYSQKGLALAETIGSKERIATGLHNIGNVYLTKRDYTEALAYFRRALTMWENMGGKKSIAEALDGIGGIQLRTGNYAEALSTAQHAAQIAREAGLHDKLWPARLTAGRAYLALKRTNEARGAFEEAVATVELMRGQVAGGEREQQRFFERKIAPYQALVELHVLHKDWDAAFAYAERGKARVLLDVLQSGRPALTTAMTPDEKAQEQSVRGALVAVNSQITRAAQEAQPDKARLAELQARREQARRAYEALQVNLYAAHPELKIQRGDMRPLSLTEAGALLPDTRTALIEYVVAEDKTYLFALTKAEGRAQPELKVYTLDVTQKDLAAQSEQFRRQLAQRDQTYGEAARRLYDLLLKPAEAQLRGKNTLVIVPDAKLWELPFQALQDTRSRHLIESRAISYSPSLTVLREMVKARGKNPGPSSPTLLAIGNPMLGKETIQRAKSVLMDEKLGPLPEAEKQVKALGELYGPTRSRVYVGLAAREDRVKAEAGDYRILQLATHGFLNDASPMYSHIFLAQEDGNLAEDGLLEAWELMNLNLNADLVVLSACETARGRVGVGEGVIGLSWALFVAGSPVTVVSQWKVESASTTELMLEFHRNLRRQSGNPGRGMSTTNALQGAAKKLLASRAYRHPFYWAGFVAVGDGR